MLAIRTSSFRRAPALSARFTRLNSDAAGSVARSKEFSKKEKAHEDQFVKQHELRQLQKLRDEINAKKLQLAALEKEHAEALEKSK